jgi:hypothetical protein
MLPEYNQIKVGFPLGKYLQQLFSNTSPRIWVPVDFWLSHRVELLERCFALNARELNSL